MNDPRIVPCQCCGSEGRIYDKYYTWQDGWIDRDIGPCEACEGTGGEIIETEPITMEDLEHAYV